MKHARVAFSGAIHEATPHANGLQLADGRVLTEDAVVWLPPFEAGTIIALGLNYADHAKELSFGKQEDRAPSSATVVSRAARRTPSLCTMNANSRW
jgi:5-oxopent-3-ene-1,2,5-tricarboxylate decarboxylase / 2-hydroxyhepta-2,4-diene-1,7-dioate isomerase